jgi:hypothetical protein
VLSGSRWPLLQCEPGIQECGDWFDPQVKTLQARIVSGSVILLSGSGLTTAVNLAYNISIARFLGPKGFGHATAVYTILTLDICSDALLSIHFRKGGAQQSSPEEKAAAYRGFHRSAWGCGILVALLLLLFQGTIAEYLNLPGSTLVALLAVAPRSTFRWDAGEATFRAPTDSAVLLRISLLKALLGSADRCS